jgi:phosphoenolpyruvate---glycerone phosphotransferase subunit DhaM
VSVGLVVVSHSAKVAEGVVELAGQMAGGVRIQPAGGTDDGGIGTDAILIAEAIAAADDGDGVLVLVDLGSAVLSAQLAIDELVEEDTRSRVRIAEAPVVEGAVVAAIQASTGSSLAEVDRAARGAATMSKVKDQPEGSGEPQGGAPVDREGSGEPQGGAPVDREGSGEPRGGAPVDQAGS